MWPRLRFTSANSLRLREVLAKVKERVDRSEESDWTPFTPSEVSSDLAAAIARLDEGLSIDGSGLAMLFAPTGPIQEIALGSGWSDDYLTLSSEFDALAPKA